MINVNGSGTSIVVIAIQSFPLGFTISEFADDVDPISAEEVEPAGFEMLYDGSLFAFDKASPIVLTVSVIAGTPDDMNLKIITQSKRGGASLLPFNDSISMIITYPDGGRVMLSSGVLIKGMVPDSITTNGRRKSNSYTFAFGSFTGAQSAKQLVTGIAQAGLGLL